MKKRTVIISVLAMLTLLSFASASIMDYWGNSFVKEISRERSISSLESEIVLFADQSYRYFVDFNDIIRFANTESSELSETDFQRVKDEWTIRSKPDLEGFNILIENDGKLFYSSDTAVKNTAAITQNQRYYYISLMYSHGSCIELDSNSEINLHCQNYSLENAFYNTQRTDAIRFQDFLKSTEFIGHKNDSIIVYITKTDLPLMIDQRSYADSMDWGAALLPIGFIASIILTLFFLIIKDEALRDIGIFKVVRKIKFELITPLLAFALTGAAFLLYMTYVLYTQLSSSPVSYLEFLLSSPGLALAIKSTAWFILYSLFIFVPYLLKSYYLEGIYGFIRYRTFFGFIFIDGVARIMKSNKLFLGLTAFLLIDLFIIISFLQAGRFFAFLAVLNIIGLFIVILKFISDNTHDFKAIEALTNDLNEGRFKNTRTQNLNTSYFSRLQDQLLEVQQSFEKAVEDELRSRDMKTELITNVSHDLKTPITGMQNYLELLQDSQLDEESRQSYLDRLLHYTKRLGILVNDLFDLSKAKSGEIHLEYIKLNIVEMLEQILIEQDKELEAAGLELVLNTQLKNEMIVLDSEKTYRSLSNIIANIAKYALAHTRVYIDIKENSEFLIITAKNISKEALVDLDKNLTARFVRGDRSRTSSGHGLGLSIAKSFIEAQDGMLKVEIDADLFTVIIALPKHQHEYEEVTSADQVNDTE